MQLTPREMDELGVLEKYCEYFGYDIKVCREFLDDYYDLTIEEAKKLGIIVYKRETI